MFSNTYVEVMLRKTNVVIFHPDNNIQINYRTSSSSSPRPATRTSI